MHVLHPGTEVWYPVKTLKIFVAVYVELLDFHCFSFSSRIAMHSCVSVSDIEAAHVFSTYCPPASCIASTAPPAKFNIPDAQSTVWGKCFNLLPNKRVTLWKQKSKLISKPDSYKVYIRSKALWAIFTQKGKPHIEKIKITNNAKPEKDNLISRMCFLLQLVPNILGQIVYAGHCQPFPVTVAALDVGTHHCFSWKWNLSPQFAWLLKVTYHKVRGMQGL